MTKVDASMGGTAIRFQVRIAADDTSFGGASFTGASDQNLLAAMEAAGAKGVAVGCRGGGCGRCKVRVLSGDYVTGKMARTHVSTEEEGQGYGLACRIYPRSDMVVTWQPPMQQGPSR